MKDWRERFLEVICIWFGVFILCSIIVAFVTNHLWLGVGIIGIICILLSISYIIRGE